MSQVFVLGGDQTDFARNYAREGKEIADLFADVVDSTLAATGVEAADIDAIHVGNAALPRRDSELTYSSTAHSPARLKGEMAA